jgi:D-sedoheptulose 7-phosphate isomerase
MDDDPVTSPSQDASRDMPEVALVRGSLLELSLLARTVAEGLSEDLVAVAHMASETVRGGGKLMFCGNGGSAADSQHLAAELVVRFRLSRRALPALSLTTDSSILTAGGNDLGFEGVFERQVEALGNEGDMLFLHSTSGESENLIRAADAARRRGLTTVALLARGGGRLRERVDRALIVPTEVTSHAQELHLAMGHLICDLVERAFAAEGSD